MATDQGVGGSNPLAHVEEEIGIFPISFFEFGPGLHRSREKRGIIIDKYFSRMGWKLVIIRKYAIIPKRLARTNC